MASPTTASPTKLKENKVPIHWRDGCSAWVSSFSRKRLALMFKLEMWIIVLYLTIYKRILLAVHYQHESHCVISFWIFFMDHQLRMHREFTELFSLMAHNAHRLLLPLNVCRKKNFYLPWECEHERHEYERCVFCSNPPFASFLRHAIYLRCQYDE